MADKLYHLSKLVQVLEMNPQFTASIYRQCMVMYGYLQHVCKTSTKMYSNIHVQTHWSHYNGQQSCPHHSDPQRKGLCALELQSLPLAIFFLKDQSMHPCIQ